jgi:hypothetical protein
LFDGVFDHEPEGALLCSLETTKDLYMLMKKITSVSSSWLVPSRTNSGTGNLQSLGLQEGIALGDLA